MEEPGFIVHHKGDSLGVVVVEDVKAGQKLRGWIMDTNETIELTAAADIPLGHKVALSALKKGDTVLKYGNDVGRADDDIGVGGYVHFHNIKSKRW